jgi:hypothetical protein
MNEQRATEQVAIPKYIADVFGSAQKFRSHHRKHLKRAALWLDEARRGCVYSPDYKEVVTACEAIKKAIELCRVKNWERKSK